MRKIGFSLIVIFFVTIMLNGQNAWINEVHYDNEGGDTGEFIEVVIENSDTYPYSNYSVTEYNGSDQETNGNHSLNTFTAGSTVNGFTFYYKLITGIQNETEGISLQYEDELIQFLSYEGSFEALNGPAINVTSTDIGVAESGSTPVGASLGLTGSGTSYLDFTWTTFSDDTPGQPNDEQALPITLTEFIATLLYNEYVSIIWVTQSESNISHFNLYRNDLFLGSKEATNTTSTVTYEFIDAEIEDDADYAYTLEAVELDGEIHIYGPYNVHVDLNDDDIQPPDLPEVTGLVGNYPNPFNPSTTIYFNVKEGETASLSIYNPKGQLIDQDTFDAGTYHYAWENNGNESGIYLYKLESPSYSHTKKMLILK